MAIGTTIDKSLVIQFSDQVHFNVQQTQSRLRKYVEVRKMTGDRMAYDGLGSIEARELTSRFSETQFDDIEHLRRKITKRRFSVTLPIDANDVEGALVDPQNNYAGQAAKALVRAMDRVIYDAMFADVYTGRDFETTVTASSDGVSTVNATGGLTLAKLLEIKQNFMDAEVGNDEPRDVVCGISGDEHTTLLQIATLTSRDYSTQMAIEKGQIVQAAGMGLIPFGANARKPVLRVASGVRDCFAMASGAICVGMVREMQITVKDRPDYVDTTQVQVTGVWGAVRTEGKLVQKLTTTDA